MTDVTTNQGYSTPLETAPSQEIVVTPDAPPKRKFGGAQPGAGRPTKYSLELAQRICDLLIDGKNLIQICKLPGMPVRSTVIKWVDEHEKFGQMYTRAREHQGEYFVDQVAETARRSTAETANADRVKIDGYKWTAVQSNPRKYGPKVDVNQSVTMSFVDLIQSAYKPPEMVASPQQTIEGVEYSEIEPGSEVE